MLALNALTAEPHIREALAVAGEALCRITVAVTDGACAHGSGVVWSSDGLIVTNAHVLTGRAETVELWDGRRYPATIVRRDPSRDLAALRIDADELAAAVPADPLAVKPGALVLAVGHPFGVRGALSLGVLHSRPLSARGTGGQWLRADVALAPGNSGGPLSDAAGRVLGLNTMIVAGLAFAIPSTAVTRFLSATIDRAFLGVSVRAVRFSGRSGRIGFLILQLAAGSGAEAAGLTIGDVISAVGGVRFAGPSGLAAALEDGRPGDRLEVEVIRGFERMTREVELRPAPARPRAA